MRDDDVSPDRIPDVQAIGDVHCPCGEYVFTCVEAIDIDSNQTECPACGLILETMETE